ncbi:hypothetical protein GALMADRAFT_245830 [Galerina marginata CBS 339.88]|uniref:Hydrophobin n=1 Tax=Galerina marginata (strain CBS 339.88) TaxID=685588 RepID=A0A067T3I6_GALM3|nr:hypothetical protein GALMADRAFT_245830 [Galerina marginata CBS 339.88]
MKLLHVLSFVVPLLLASPALSAAAICCVEGCGCTGQGGGCDVELKGHFQAEIAALLANPTLELVNLEGTPVSPENCCCSSANSLNCRSLCGDSIRTANLGSTTSHD